MTGSAGGNQWLATCRRAHGGMGSQAARLPNDQDSYQTDLQNSSDRIVAVVSSQRDSRGTRKGNRLRQRVRANRYGAKFLSLATPPIRSRHTSFVSVIDIACRHGNMQNQFARAGETVKQFTWQDGIAVRPAESILGLERVKTVR